MITGDTAAFVATFEQKVVELAGIMPKSATLKKYGITQGQFLQMYQYKEGGCHICGRKPKPGKKLYIDHDHKTCIVRGLLCFTCNYRLLGRGSLGKASVHRAAADYLDSLADWRKLA